MLSDILVMKYNFQLLKNYRQQTFFTVVGKERHTTDEGSLKEKKKKKKHTI